MVRRDSRNGVVHEAALRSRVGLDRDLTSYSSATFSKHRWPRACSQSSCSFSRQLLRRELAPLTAHVPMHYPCLRSEFIGHASAARTFAPVSSGPGVHVVALVPVADPFRRQHTCSTVRQRLRRFAPASEMDVLSIAPAVRILPSPAITSVDAPTTSSGSTLACVSGLPALPTSRFGR